MVEGGVIDRRTRRFGRVVPFQVRLPDLARLSLAARQTRLVKAAFKMKGDQLVKPGFEDPHVVRGVLCVRYLKVEERVVEWPGGERKVVTPLYTAFYDMLGESSEGYILVGKYRVRDATLGLALYLEALGLDPNMVVARPVLVLDSAMKEMFFDDRVNRKAFRARGVTQVILRTALPELTVDKYYQRLEDAGIEDEEWEACEFLPPAIAASGKTAPRVHLRQDGFTVRSSYLNHGTWHYVEWLLWRIEAAMRATQLVRRRTPTLFDAYGEGEASESAT
jgi:hypothetical protein